MKVTFTKEELLLAITKSLGCVSTEKTINSIEGILITTIGEDKCQLCAYDLEKGIKIVIGAQVESGGVIVMNGNKLSNIVKYMPGNVTIETNPEEESGMAVVSSGRSKFQIHYISGDTFPQMPELNPDRKFSLPQKLLKKLISQTIFAVSQDETRPALMGLYFEITENTVTVVGCNSYSVAIRENKVETNVTTKRGETEINFIIPVKTVAELSKLLADKDDPIQFSLTRKHALFYFGMKCGAEDKEAVLFSRLIDVPYIDYRRFIPKESKTFVEIERDALEDSMERASIVTEERIVGQAKSVVRFHFKDNILAVSALSVSGNFFDEINIEKTGNDLEIGFTCKYLLEILRATDAGTLKLSLTSSYMIMVIEGANTEDTDSRFLYLALPVKLRD
ncbi:MAG: DNA polymerase III subunit beta [Clostridia bacterium]|nr:DNA polymerase III subunit beta [Clostridia bacterium]MBR6744700.1 DNA polymerase III subunit beta [Clostridia bacterium]